MKSNNSPALSLLTAYRDREAHLNVLLPWLARVRETEQFTDFELILVEGDTRPTVRDRASEYDWVRYEYVPLTGSFHKARLLNRAAAVSQGAYYIVYDVDLLAAEGVLRRHLSLVQASPHCLVAGYRLQLAEMPDPTSTLPTADDLLSRMNENDAALVCSEDDSGATLRYLLHKERFGVCPCYPATLFNRVGGLHEGFIGWGAEDQDLLERVCDQGITLIRSYDLLYLHLPHDHQALWCEPKLIIANRERFAQRRRERLK